MENMVIRLVDHPSLTSFGCHSQQSVNHMFILLINTPLGVFFPVG